MKTMKKKKYFPGGYNPPFTDEYNRSGPGGEEELYKFPPTQIPQEPAEWGIIPKGIPPTQNYNSNLQWQNTTDNSGGLFTRPSTLSNPTLGSFAKTRSYPFSASVKTTPVASQNFQDKDGKFNTGEASKTGSGGLPWSKGEKWGTAIAGAGTLSQLGMALQKADKEKFRANPYAGNILANLPQNMDLRPLHQQIDRNMNTSRAYIDEGTSSQAVRRANILGLGANASNQKSQLGVQEQQFNNQARVQRAQIFDGLGESDRRTRLLIDDQNARNKGQRLTNISSALKDVSQFGVNTANIGTFKTGQNINFAFVNSLSSKYKIDMTDIAKIIESERPKSAEELEKSIIKFKG